MCVCVCLPDIEQKESGHSFATSQCASLYSGCVLGELVLTSGCFLRESEQHRKSKLVCQAGFLGGFFCAGMRECESDGKLCRFIAVS